MIIRLDSSGGQCLSVAFVGHQLSYMEEARGTILSNQFPNTPMPQVDVDVYKNQRRLLTDTNDYSLGTENSSSLGTNHLLPLGAC